MGSAPAMDEMLELLQIGDSRNPSKRAMAYEKSAKLCFACARLETREALSTDPHHPSLGSAEKWVEKALQCYGMAIQELGHASSHRFQEPLFQICTWDVDVFGKPSFLQSLCKRLDEGPPSLATALAHFLLSVSLYTEGVLMIREYQERFDVTAFESCLGFIKDALQASEKSFDLCKSLRFSGDLLQQHHVETQLTVKTMKVYLQLVELTAKSEGMEDYNECLQAWYNYSLPVLQTLPDSNELPHGLLHIKKVSEKGQDVLPLFLQTFNFIRTEYIQNLSSSHLEEVLSILSSKKEQHEARRQSERSHKEILMQLKEKIRALRMESNKSAEAFLGFIYQEYPHPNPKFKLGSIRTPEETKEALRSAIFHYHPDSNVRHDREWIKLCNEITKFLNNKYANYN